MDRYMQAPLNKEEVKALEAGDYVYITEVRSFPLI